MDWRESTERSERLQSGSGRVYSCSVPAKIASLLCADACKQSTQYPFLNRLRVQEATKHLPFATDRGAGRPAEPKEEEDDEEEAARAAAVAASVGEGAALAGEFAGFGVGEAAAFEDDGDDAAPPFLGLTAPHPGNPGGAPAAGRLMLSRLASEGFA